MFDSVTIMIMDVIARRADCCLVTADPGVKHDQMNIFQKDLQSRAEDYPTDPDWPTFLGDHRGPLKVPESIIGILVVSVYLNIVPFS